MTDGDLSRVARPARRLEQLPPYLFAEADRRIREKRAAGHDVVSLGVGDPDLPTPPHVVDALAAGARDPKTHRYPEYYGLDELRAAIAIRWIACGAPESRLDFTRISASMMRGLPTAMPMRQPVML